MSTNQHLLMIIQNCLLPSLVYLQEAEVELRAACRCISSSLLRHRRQMKVTSQQRIYKKNTNVLHEHFFNTYSVYYLASQCAA